MGKKGLGCRKGCAMKKAVKAVLLSLLLSCGAYCSERSGRYYYAWNEITHRSVQVCIHGGGSPQRWYENIIKTIRRGPGSKKYFMARAEYNWLRQELDPNWICCWGELVTEWRRVSRR
jgi:hypothetical protein